MRVTRTLQIDSPKALAHQKKGGEKLRRRTAQLSLGVSGGRLGRRPCRFGVRASDCPSAPTSGRAAGGPRVGTRPGGGPRSDFSRVRTSTGPLDTGALVRLPLERPVRRSLRLTVARSHGDLELNDLIPLLVASIALGDGKKFSEPATRILGR